MLNRKGKKNGKYFFGLKNVLFRASYFGYRVKGCLSGTPSFSLLEDGAKLKTPSQIFPPLRSYADVSGMFVKEYVYVWLCFAQPLENQKRTYTA